jgi:hypothetical protein
MIDTADSVCGSGCDIDVLSLVVTVTTLLGAAEAGKVIMTRVVIVL